MRTPKQFNNITERVIDDLKQVLSSGNSQISIAAASFSIYAYEALKEELEKVDCVNFIFTSPTFYTDKSEKQKREFYIPKLNRERSLFGSDFEIRLRNQLTQRAIARECADWIRRKARFKTNITHGSMNTFLNIKEGEETYTYMPFNEFTTTELGLDRGNNICPMVVGMPGHSSTDMFLKNFAELWKDKEKFQDVTDNVIENIETVYKENAPAFIYFITLYNIFNEFLEDISEDVLPNEATGFKSSVIWNKLYNFQRDASLAIINKLEKYNGCILADSVGLGKTFTALSVIKYYENRNRNVLVLCPKKLNDNWQTFRSNYKNNPVLADRLRYDILFHSDLSRDKGLSNGLDLERVNWGNYDLIVIDESHNFRNGGRFDNEDEDDDFKENRYARLMNKVIRSGVKTKVLMLSATPVNNRFSDLKNQLQLAYEGKAENINDLLDTGKNIDSIFRDAQTVYSKWAKLPLEKRTTEKLVDSLSYDFFQLLDAVTIARSRSHIIKYYNTNDVGKFPERLSPVSRRPKLTDLNDAITFADIAEMLNRLNLSIYTPSLFIFESEKGNYGIDYEGEGLTVDGREKGIRKLMAINLLKRLIVLDFFSGSATTAHALMKMNSNKNFQCKFILVQLSEEVNDTKKEQEYKNICEIGKERIRRAGKKIKEEFPLTTQNLDTGFRVFRLADSNFEEVKKAPAEYNQSQLDLFLNNVKSDRTDLDLLFGAMLSWGVQLSLPMTSEEVDGKMIYSVNDGDLVACFADDITENIVKAMADKQPLRVLFRDSCFARDDAKINVFETLKQLLDWSEEEAIKNIKVI